MNRDIELNLIERCYESFNTKKTTEAAQSTLDTSRYISESRFQLEHEKIFTKAPTPIVHWSEIREPHSFKKQTTSLGELIVTRDHNGDAHVFYNACRHRGTELVNESKGCAKRFTCPYHAWSYGSDGKLMIVPAESQCFSSIDKSALGLNEIPSVEKYGFVWVCPTATDRNSAVELVDSYLGKEMAASFQWLNLDKLYLCKSVTKRWNANWKILSEGGMETYHFTVAHANTLAPYFLNNTAVIDQLGKNFRVTMPNKNISTVAELPTDQQKLRECTHVVFSCFPSYAMLFQGDHIDWFNTRPISATETEITISSLVEDDPMTLTPKQESHWQRNIDITVEVLDEDYILGESIQRSFSSGVVTEVHLGSNEWALKAFNNIVDQMCGSH